MTKMENVIIRASAGTGKTFQLSNRYLKLLFLGAEEHEILASTFTRKAAAEILDRVLVRLATACKDTAACAELAGHLDITDLTPRRCRDTLRKLTGNLHRVNIGTLDSFFARLAGSFSFEIGLPIGWSILEAQQDDQLRDRAIELLLRDGSTEDVMRLVRWLTKGHAERSVSDLVRQQVNNLYNVYLAAPSEAWSALPRPNPLSRESLADTIEALENVALPQNKHWQKAVAKDIEAIRAGDWETLLGKGIAHCLIEGKPKYQRVEIPDDIAAIYRQLIRHGKAILLRTLADQTEAARELLDRFASRYDPLKHEQRGLLFDDVTRHLANYLLDSRDDDRLGRLAYRLNSNVKHLLLDEFQDTSVTQWQVLFPFAARTTTGTAEPTTDAEPTGPPSSFFCVGDEKQAIYRWRGGVAELFAEIETQLHGLVPRKLDVSRRSAPAIIDTVNLIFQGIGRHDGLNRGAEALHKWQTRFRTHKTVLADLPGYAELSTAPRAGEDEKQAEVTISHAALRIAEITRNAPGCSIGVLVRRNAAVARLIYEIRRLGIEASEEGGNALTDSPAVQAIVSLLRVADHPGDTAARMHLAYSPLGPLVGMEDHRDDAKVEALASATREKLQTEGYGQAMEFWAHSLMPCCGRRDQNRLMQLVEMAYDYPADNIQRTDPFIWYIENTIVPDANAARVRVMTVHQAKGLEFDVVVLPELDTKLLGQDDLCVVGRESPTSSINRVCMYPNSTIQSLMSADFQTMFTVNFEQRVSEQLCNLYVAITRPIHALYMIIAPSSTRERKLPAFYSGLVRAALTDAAPVAPSSTLFVIGDADWFNKPGVPPVVAAEPAVEKVVKKAPPPEIQLASMPQRTRGLERKNPSRLAHGGTCEIASLFRATEQSSMDRGTMLHACFEQVEWLDEGNPDHNTLKEALRDFNSKDYSPNDAVREFNRMLDCGDTPSVLRRSHYCPENQAVGKGALAGLDADLLRLDVSNERTIAVTHDNGLLVGSIDRLVLVYDSDRLVAADIIDFKSDAIDTDDQESVAKKVDDYRPQMESYRTAVSKIYGLKKEAISARLLFVNQGLVGEV